MSDCPTSTSRRWFSIAAALLFLGCLAPSSGPISIKTQLVWGTDGAKPDDKNLEELEPKTREKLRHLRWKNYWVVKAKVLDVTSQGVQKAVLSDKCAVEFSELPDGKLEVKLLSITKTESKVVKTVHFASDALKNGEYLVLGGDDKEKWDDAWIVIISCGKQK